MQAPSPSRLASPKAARLARPLGRAPQAARLFYAALTALSLSACRELEGRFLSGDGKFVGSYRTTWGPIVLRQQGDELEGLYRRGELRCLSEDRTLRCMWAQGHASGRAILRRRDDGLLEGTWGRGDRDNDGGAWLWAPDERPPR
ncbi:MAG: hypothetical protein MUF34_15695 [Polyangiaceae bacterium]|nr:hypothetical protein [Polyangiaceae bacterium]